MIILNERKLERIKCMYEPGTDCFVFKVNGKSFSISGAESELLIKVFKRCKVKDGGSLPLSSRNNTYEGIVNDIKNNSISSNYIWSENISSFEEELEGLSKKGKYSES